MRHKFRVQSVKYSPDGSQIISGSDDEFVCIWDSEGELVKARRHKGMVKCVAYNGNKIASICGMGLLHVTVSI